MIGAIGTGPRPAPEGENKKTPETNLMISGMRGGRRRGARETGGGADPFAEPRITSILRNSVLHDRQNRCDSVCYMRTIVKP